MATSKIESASLASDAVDNTNIDSTLITAQTAITSLADTDKFLVSDASDSGNLKYVEKQYLPSGGLVPLTQSTGSSGTDNVIVNGWISDTYENYVMYYDFTPATNGTSIRMTLYDSSGNLSGTEYDYVSVGATSSNGSAQNMYGQGETSFQIANDVHNDSARVGLSGMMTWKHPRLSGKRTTILHSYKMLDFGATARVYSGVMDYKATQAITGFYVNASSGQIKNWRVRCYGIVNS